MDERWIVEDRGFDTPCWMWQRSVDKRLGYGLATAKDGRKTTAHRVIYEERVGAIPEGLTLDHLCRVRGCVNPEHLEPVTLRENVLRGTSPAAINAKKTHCPKGHPYDEDNTRWTEGRRRCRICLREQRGSVHLLAAERTHCPQGHPYEGDNLYITPKGHRECRACNRAKVRRRYAENPEYRERVKRAARESYERKKAA